MNLALWVFDADDEHMFCHPAFGLGLVASDTQRVTLFAQQCIAAIARANAFNHQLFREVHDEASIRAQITGGMKAFYEGTAFLDTL